MDTTDEDIMMSAAQPASSHGGGSSKDDLGDMTFCMGNYAKEALKMMYMMRQHHMLTDCVLEVENEVFHVHKVVLSSASPYFKVSHTPH
jgi:kelch-like protein 19